MSKEISNLVNVLIRVGDCLSTLCHCPSFDSKKSVNVDEAFANIDKYYDFKLRQSELKDMDYKINLEFLNRALNQWIFTSASEERKDVDFNTYLLVVILEAFIASLCKTNAHIYKYCNLIRYHLVGTLNPEDFEKFNMERCQQFFNWVNESLSLNHSE